MQARNYLWAIPDVFLIWNFTGSEPLEAFMELNCPLAYIQFYKICHDSAVKNILSFP